MAAVSGAPITVPAGVAMGTTGTGTTGTGTTGTGTTDTDTGAAGQGASGSAGRGTTDTGRATRSPMPIQRPRTRILTTALPLTSRRNLPPDRRFATTARTWAITRVCRRARKGGSASSC